MTPQEWIVLHKKELTSAGIAAVVMLVLFAICFYLPTPSLKDAPTSTKETKVSLQGSASPLVGITIFNASGTAVLTVNTDDKGAFSLMNVPIGEGKNILTIRAVASGWKASFPLTLEITKDTTAPALSIDSLQGASITGSNTVLTGKAEPGSSVTVNGVKASVNPDGTWTATIALATGKNTVTVAATDAAGNTTTNTQTISYQPSAPNSQTGTATTTLTTTTLSPGSQPAPVVTSTTTPAPVVTSPTPSPAPAPSPSPAPAPTPVPAPAPTPVLSIVANAWVSNQTPNQRANETIYASVKDNYGRPVTNATVTASVYFKTGIATYVLRSTGGGNYSASFKLNDKYVSGYHVNIEVAAHLNTFTSNAQTGFTPM